ncbi:MAG TPA: SOS response-associated peptidase [Candidatus Baltobacteraceae bacterium]|nr:SOS response-associated peptidase [Candidatus Baltobacteraceae bacterium]
MCGRFTLTKPQRIGDAYPRYRFEEFSEYRLPRFNIAPTQGVLAVRNDGTERVEPLEWGIGGRINARAETVVSKPAPLRCIIFADGFYEWRGRKPVYYTMRDERVFVFAGIWEPAINGPPECAIVTCPPNELVAPVHNRMPVILGDKALDEWLAPGDLDPERARIFMQPYSANEMTARDVSMRLNDARNDRPDVLLDDDPVQETLF